MERKTMREQNITSQLEELPEDLKYQYILRDTAIDFSLHSIGVILFRNNKDTIFLEFTKDVIPKVEIITLQKSLYEDLAQDKKTFGLDFDDLYQYKIAKQRDLKIVTMDKDFEKVKKEIEIIFL
ncbi:MAG: PIN domain-containing protein [Nitrospirae bacterium]|nr:PIN domain-containing protein [Nitrospirota bacterium]